MFFIYKMQLVIDDREKHVIPYIEAFHDDTEISYEVKRLEVGDYAIVYKGFIMLIIERKTWTDLAASIRDGRKSNINKLTKVREESSCQIAYLIEGTPCPENPNKLYARMPYKNLRAHLDHLAFRDGVHMIYSNNLEYTAKRLFELCRNMFSTKELIKEIDDISGGKEKNTELLTTKQQSQVSYQEQLLMCLPSIGSVVATVLAEKGITLLDIYNNKYTSEELARFKYPTGNSIGLARAQRIISNRTYLTKENKQSSKIQIRILSTIKGVSKKTAESILEVVKFTQIMDGLIDINTLKEINRGKSKVGQKVAETILQMLINYKVDDDKKKKDVKNTKVVNAKLKIVKTSKKHNEANNQ